jgi:predicted ATP-grasp superfamily ATP-dependent carboligase
MLFNRGQLKAKVAYRQLRDYPASGGQATLRVSLRSEMAERFFQTFLEELQWHGPCQADFIVDRQSGVPYLIDVNPRLWGSLTQAIASGVDFPYLIYRLAKDGDVPIVESFKTGIVTRWIGGDLAALPSRLRESRQKLAIMRDFLFPSTPATLLDDFSMDDPLPLVTWCADAVARAVKFRSTSPVSHDSLDGIWE